MFTAIKIQIYGNLYARIGDERVEHFELIIKD